MAIVDIDPNVLGIDEFETGYILFLARNSSVKYQSVDNMHSEYELMTDEYWLGYSENVACYIDGSQCCLNLDIRAMLVDIQTRSPVRFELHPRSKGEYMDSGVFNNIYSGSLMIPPEITLCQIQEFMGQQYFQIVAPTMEKIHIVLEGHYLPITWDNS